MAFPHMPLARAGFAGSALVLACRFLLQLANNMVAKRHTNATTSGQNPPPFSMAATGRPVDELRGTGVDRASFVDAELKGVSAGAGNATPTPEISNAGTCRSGALLTACSIRSPLATPGLVKSAA